MATAVTATTTTEYLLLSADANWNYARWEQLPDNDNRYEVVDGVLYVSTAPNAWHQRCIYRLTRHVAVPLEDSGFATSFTSPVGVLMQGADPVQPDFLLLRAERMPGIIVDGKIRGVPDLIAEVLSPSHPELDTVIKRGAYARAGVPEYWIVRPASRDVLVCSQPDAQLSDFTEVRHFAADDELVSATLPISLPVAALFQDLPAED
jgi:Uma2 family endonuclease